MADDGVDWMRPLPVRRVEADPDRRPDPMRWPATLAPVRQLLDEGLDLDRLTILVGGTGSGKSTLVEAIAMCYGLNGEGGGTGAMNSTFASESKLHHSLRLVRGPGATRWGYFLRAETVHGLFTYLADHPGRSPDGARMHRLSHGESFLAFLADPNRFAHGGFFVLDEPEAGLSFTAQLTLVGELAALAAHEHGQVLLATHSPIVAAVPGARILQLDGSGLTQMRWEELDLVDHDRLFLGRPDAYLHHLLGDGPSASGE